MERKRVKPEFSWRISKVVRALRVLVWFIPALIQLNHVGVLHHLCFLLTLGSGYHGSVTRSLILSPVSVHSLAFAGIIGGVALGVWVL
ncbi:hypothetical protein C8R48DRAFT_739482 [Suillus tomentosus]|nr:hypothetical protein C8R48DRAFT_739482 [Suillus tomentosus]